MISKKEVDGIREGYCPSCGMNIESDHNNWGWFICTSSRCKFKCYVDSFEIGTVSLDSTSPKSRIMRRI